MVQVAESSNVEAKSNVSPKLYRFFRVFLRTIPMLMAGLYLGNTVLSFFNIDISLFSYLAGIGLIPWLFILISSYLFKFCEYHRMFLWYILINNIICWTDEEIGIPLDNWNYLVLHVITAGLFIFFILIVFMKIKIKLF